MIDIVRRAKRHPGVGAVDRGRRGVNEMPASRVPASFEHVEKAREIGIDIGMRIDQGMPHAGLGSEVHDGGETIRRKHLIHTASPVGPKMTKTF